MLDYTNRLMLMYGGSIMSNGNVKKAKKGLLNVVFSRAALVAVLLLVQIAVFVVGINFLAQYGWIVYGFFILLSALIVIKIINEKGNPAFKLSWILLILVIPVVGAAFYIFVQLQIGTRYIGRRLAILNLETRNYMTQDYRLVEDIRNDKPANANLAHFLSQQVGFPIHCNTEVTYFPLGEEKYKELLHQLKQAKNFIFLEYFIVEEGVMWNTILNVLREKVSEGVEVRFMYDGMCSMAQLPYNYPKKVRAVGVQCKMFSPIKPIMSTHQNNRDHRKICVIDGQVAFTGGVNLADEYINQKERFGHWKDTAIMLRGEAVQSFTMLFLQMWNINVKEPEQYEKYLSSKSSVKRADLGYVLPYGDSPFDNENVGEQVYFHILNHAKKYVHIMTPYLILDNEMVTNLTYTAKCGIEVIVIMPHIPDKWYAFALAKTYYAELLEAGVQIYEYTPGFVHAKVFVSDDDTATVGTINLDYRSLYLHFECGAFIYDNPVVADIECDFQETLKKCEKISLTDINGRKFIEKAVGNVLRLVAPLM